MMFLRAANILHLVFGEDGVRLREIVSNLPLVTAGLKEKGGQNPGHMEVSKSRK